MTKNDLRLSSDDEEEALVAALLASSARVIWIVLVDDGRVCSRAH